MFKSPNNHPIIQSMSKKIIIIILMFIALSVNSKEKSKFYEEGVKNFDRKLYEKAIIDFEKNIVRNPKDIRSYLYLSKIYKYKKNNDEFEKNLNTTLLLDPKNEEALYLLISKKISDGDYDIAQKKLQIFNQSCKTLCKKTNELSQSLKKPKN